MKQSKINFFDYAKAVEWMIANRDKHPIMDVELLDAHDGQDPIKVYVIEYELN